MIPIQSDAGKCLIFLKKNIWSSAIIFEAENYVQFHFQTSEFIILGKVDVALLAGKT